MPKQPKDAYYFTHDSNARNDKNMIKLRRKMGMEGFGIYWCIIEILREEADYRMQLLRIDDIAFQINSTHEKVKEVITSFGLFKIEDEYFYSESLNRRMDLYKEVKQKYSVAGKKGMESRWGKKEDQPNAPPLKRVQ